MTEEGQTIECDECENIQRDVRTVKVSGIIRNLCPACRSPTANDPDQRRLF